MNAQRARERIRQAIIFAALGAVMPISKIAMEALPNIHLLSMLTIVYTVVYRKKGVIPVLIGMLLIGAVNGFALWWVPYLYIWPLLSVVTMLLPKKFQRK